MRRWDGAVAIGVLLGAGMARATTITAMSDAQLAAQSVAIVRAHVRAVAVGARTDGTPKTEITLAVLFPIAGPFGAGEEILLTEPGGAADGRTLVVFGAPRYRVGDEVLVYVARRWDGTYHTASLERGASRILDRITGEIVAVQAGDELTRAVPIADALTRAWAVRGALRSSIEASPVVEPPADQPVQDSFTYLGTPTRWFEPLESRPVPFAVDGAGLIGMLPAGLARSAIWSGMDAWRRTPGAAIWLADGGVATKQPYSCAPPARIVFDDPGGQLSPLVNCAGVLAVGGYCASNETRIINGHVFRRAIMGYIVFNRGLGACLRGDTCKLAEIAAHELGHTLGFGHSEVLEATMSASAHFDGRCGSLKADDIAAVRAAYPVAIPMPTPTRTPACCPCP